MRVGVVVFPGSNCDYDVFHLIRRVLDCSVDYIWHKDSSLRLYDAIVLPGGFSYGDYLRPGAVARFSPVMPVIIDFAKQGKPVLGICNGFQILLEAGLLPGALITNDHLRFRCQQVYIKVVNERSPFTRQYEKGQVLKMPVAHHSGNYYAEEKTLEELHKNNRIVFKYCNVKGQEISASNPNGSLANIAGILSKEGNVMGMMPHPERAAESILGSTDGLKIFKSIME